MKKYILNQQDFGAPPPPPPPSMTTPPPPPSGNLGTGGKASSRAIWALVLGILGWISCGILASIPAWIMGRKELAEIDAGRSDEAGRTMAKVGMWLGIIATILSILALIIVAIIFVIGGLSSMSK